MLFSNIYFFARKSRFKFVRDSSIYWVDHSLKATFKLTSSASSNLSTFWVYCCYLRCDMCLSVVLAAVRSLELPPPPRPAVSGQGQILHVVSVLKSEANTVNRRGPRVFLWQLNGRIGSRSNERKSTRLWLAVCSNIDSLLFTPFSWLYRRGCVRPQTHSILARLHAATAFRSPIFHSRLEQTPI